MVSIEVDGSRLGITFSASHFIQGHSKCGRLHGHNYSLSASVEGDAHQGMLVDFGPLKEALRSIANEMDHRVLIPERMGRLAEGQIEVETEGKRYSFPAGDAILLPVEMTSTEELSAMALKRLVSRINFPGGVRKVAVKVDEMGGQGAWSEKVLR